MGKPLFLFLLSGLVQFSTSAVFGQLAVRPGLDISPLRRVSRTVARPDVLDNSLSPFFPPIISQRGGSCAQAAGIHYLFGYEMNRVLERPVNNKKENMFSYRWTWHFLNEGEDQGSFASDGIEITLKAGAMTVAAYGNQDEGTFRWVTGYQKYFEAMHYKTIQMSCVDLKNRSCLETLLDYMNDKGDGHPGGGVAAFSVSSDWSYEKYFGPSKSGYDEIVVLNGVHGAHAMTLVGYDMSVEYDCNGDGCISEEEKGAFILVNSWGTWWGTNGRAYIPFYYFLTPESQGGLNQHDATALCINTAYCEPQITMSVKMKHSSRNDVFLSFGLADGAHAKTSDRGCDYRYPIVNNQGGDFNMQGMSYPSAQDIEIGFDLTPLASSLDTMKAPCFQLFVSKILVGESGSGYVYEVCVHDYRDGCEKVFKETFTEAEGRIVAGTKCLRIPTKPWVKNRRGEWLEQSTTSASPVEFSLTDKKTVYSVRTADGNYGNIQLSNYDYSTGKLNLKVTYYEK